jgi:hypothetical protein
VQISAQNAYFPLPANSWVGADHAPPGFPISGIIPGQPARSSEIAGCGWPVLLSAWPFWWHAWRTNRRASRPFRAKPGPIWFVRFRGAQRKKRANFGLQYYYNTCPLYIRTLVVHRIQSRYLRRPNSEVEQPPPGGPATNSPITRLICRFLNQILPRLVSLGAPLRISEHPLNLLVRETRGRGDRHRLVLFVASWFAAT